MERAVFTYESIVGSRRPHGRTVVGWRRQPRSRRIDGDDDRNRNFVGPKRESGRRWLLYDAVGLLTSLK